MPRKVVIEPVTRIEGHAKISIYLDDAGNVSDAKFHVVEFRGFEKFCEGRPLWEMPGITPRICGICPVSHLLASAKACDAILAVKVPPAAEKLRRVMNLGQIIQSHALSFFHLSSPDFLLGWDSPVEKRNVFGLVTANPDLARAGIRLRQFGQEIIELLGGRKIHPAWAVPGGVREALTEERRQQIKTKLPEALATAQTGLKLFRGVLKTHQREAQVFGNFPSLFMGLSNPDGVWEHYDGTLKFVDAGGNVIADDIEVNRYREVIGEASESHSYLKSPYYKPMGYPDGIYRVGPLARLNVCKTIGTPLADHELERFREFGHGAVTSSFLYHYARLIEILACVERIENMINDPILLSEHLRADAGINKLDAVGASEAPRGTLFHHYQTDERGVITKANLIVATQNNAARMAMGVEKAAKGLISGKEVTEGTLNMVEMTFRAYDPCHACATHSLPGSMPLVLHLRDLRGNTLAKVRRDGNGKIYRE